MINVTPEMSMRGRLMTDRETQGDKFNWRPDRSRRKTMRIRDVMQRRPGIIIETYIDMVIPFREKATILINVNYHFYRCCLA